MSSYCHYGNTVLCKLKINENLSLENRLRMKHGGKKQSLTQSKIINRYFLTPNRMVKINPELTGACVENNLQTTYLSFGYVPTCRTSGPKSFFFINDALEMSLQMNPKTAVIPGSNLCRL